VAGGAGRGGLKLFAFGFGYSARAAVQRLRPQLQAAWGTTRDPGKFPDIAALGVTPVLFGTREASDPPP